MKLRRFWCAVLAFIPFAVGFLNESHCARERIKLSVFNTWTQTTAANYNWHSIDSDSTGRYLIACSSNIKGVYTSADYGASWEPSASPTPFDYTGVAASTSFTKLVAVTGGTAAGGIYCSPDSGTTWVPTPAPSSLWSSVTCDESGTNIVAAIYSSISSSPGGIYYSTSGGVSFALSNAPTANWNAVASDSTGQFVVAVIYNSASGGIYRSVDYGADWALVYSLACDWTDIASDSTGARIIAVSSDGNIAISADGGAIWTLATDSAFAYSSVSSDSSGMVLNVGIASTTAGGIVRSTDGGTTWEATDAPAEDYTALSSDSSGRYIFAVTANAGIWGAIYATAAPSEMPTTTAPVSAPTFSPSAGPTSAQPSSSPSAVPLSAPTAIPSGVPQSWPSRRPSGRPSSPPSARPSASPVSPSSSPSAAPLAEPTSNPSTRPQSLPSGQPSGQPSGRPSFAPSPLPTPGPSPIPTLGPTATPTAPTVAPSTSAPTVMPSSNNTANLVLSFTSNVTLVGLTSTELNQASQTSLIATNAEIMDIAISDLTYLSSTAITSTSVSVKESIIDDHRSLRHSVGAFATFSVIATTETQIAMITTVAPSPEALYASLTTALDSAVQDGNYNTVLSRSAVAYGATQLTGATAVSVVSSPQSVSQLSSAPTPRPTSKPESKQSKEIKLILEIVSIVPGILLMFVGAFTIHYRRPRSGTLNQLRSLPAEYAHLLIRGVTLVLSVNLLLTSSLTVSDPTFLLLLVSRLFILGLCVVFFLFFVFPAKDELNSATGTSLLIRTDVLQENGAVSVYSVVIVMGLFDISMLRYLPWFRTNFTAVMDGYPNLLLVRCSLYGTFISSVIQTAAVVPALLDDQDTDTKTAIKIIALLVFNIINIVRSFMSIILHMKKVKDIDCKLAIVSENDVAALADFVNSSSSERSTIDSRDSRAVPTGPGKISDLLSEARSTSSRSRPESTAADLNAQNLASNPLHQKYPKYQHHPRDEDVLSEMTEDVDVDERGIMFATKILFADETVDILRDQVRLAGQRPLEFIPLPHLKGELEQLFECANSGVPYDTDRLDYLLLCLDHNPEYKAEQEAANRAWRAEIAPFLEESLTTMQAFIAPNIFKCSENSLVQDCGYSKPLAKRMLAKKCLWLVRISSADIDRMHIAELNGRFNPEAQNLDIVEAAAIFAVLPAQFSFDADRRKTRWRSSIEQNLKAMYKQYQAGSLTGPKKRNPVYRGQLPAFDGRETLHEMGATGNENAFAPRTSFMHIRPTADSSEQSVAGSVTSTTSGGSSYVQQMSQSLANSLLQRPQKKKGVYEVSDITGNNRSSLTMLPSQVNSPVQGSRKTSATSTTKSSNFGSELTKALAGRKNTPTTTDKSKTSSKNTEDEIL